MDRKTRLLFSICGGLAMIAIGYNVISTAAEAVTNGDARKKLLQTQAGRFAISGLEDCTGAHGLFGYRKSETECINNVVTAARNLKGEQFAAEVGRNLNTWTERSQSK